MVLPEDRYGTRANVRGRPSANCTVWYNRDTDTLVFTPTNGRRQPETLVPEGMPSFYTPPGKTFGPVGLANGAGFEIHNAEIEPITGGPSPTTPTMFNPLYIEAIERLLDTFPEMGRYRLYEAPTGLNPYSESWSARQFVTNVNEMRGTIARMAQFRELVLWHGTVQHYADKILREGLTPRNQTGVVNHWSEEWASHQGLVYLSHSSRLTVSRSAMSKAREALADEWYGDERKRLDEEGEKVRRGVDSYYGEVTPDKRAAYDEWLSRYHDLRDEIANDPRLEPVLLRVRIPPEGWKNLRPDEDTAAYSTEVSKMTGFPEWMGSIGSDAVVAYQGTIPSTWISVAARGAEAFGAGMVSDRGEWWYRSRAATKQGMAGVDPSADLAFDDRLGYCYELAGRYVLSNPGSRLVHGSIQGFGHPRIGHAWAIDADNEVFEPTSGKWYPPDEFEEGFNPEVARVYDDTEARVEMLKAQHWGPWHDEPYGLVGSKTAVVMGIPVTDVQVNPDQGASGRVADRGPVHAFRGFGSWGELKDAVRTGRWRSKGTFTVRGEGETQMALRLEEVLENSGFHGMRGSGFLGIVEADISGLPFSTWIKATTDPALVSGVSPQVPRYETKPRLYVNERGDGMMYPDIGLGIGINGGIPWDRILTIYEVDDGRITKRWSAHEWEQNIDRLQDRPGWDPEVRGDPQSQRTWVEWIEGARYFHDLTPNQNDRTVCGKDLNQEVIRKQKNWNNPIAQVLRGRASMRQIKQMTMAGWRQPLHLEGYKEGYGDVRAKPCPKCWPMLMTSSLTAAVDRPLPTGGMFSPGEDELDPRLFGPGAKLKPEVRQGLIDLLDNYWTPKYGDWQAWAHVFICGSAVSHWWDSDVDLDVLIGIDKEVLDRLRPANAQYTEEEVCATLSADLKTNLDPLISSWNGFVVTAYVNPFSYDVRSIHPYAAYDLLLDEWVVPPPDLPPDWGPQNFPEDWWAEVDLLGDQITALLERPEPQRTYEAVAMFDRLHEDRQRSYSRYGRGWMDWGNFAWQALSAWGLLPKLYRLKHPELAKTAASTRTLWRGLQLADVTVEELEDALDNPSAFIRNAMGGYRNVGIHWTDDPNSAWNFAMGRDPEGWAHESWGDDEDDLIAVGVILEAEVAEGSVLEEGSDEWQGYAMSDAIFSHDHGEAEVTVRGGAPVRVTEATLVWDDGDGNTQERRVPLSLSTTASIWIEHRQRELGPEVFAVEGGRVVGALAVFGHDRSIARVYVRPSHRRQGIATRLLKAMEHKIGPIRHSDDMTPDGAQWANAVDQEGGHVSTSREEGEWEDWLDDLERGLARGASIEAPGEESLTLYHGTTSNAWDAIRQGGFAPQDLLAQCHAIEDEFELPRGSIWKHPINDWARKRRREGERKTNLYLTTDRKEAEKYAIAGSAPLYDFLKAAYYLKYPEKIEKSFFGPYAAGLTPWIRDEVLKRGGGPVLITFDVPESVVRQAPEVAQRVQMMRNDDWSSIKAWLLTGTYIRQDGISLPSAAGLMRYVESVERLEMPDRIQTQNSLGGEKLWWRMHPEGRDFSPETATSTPFYGPNRQAQSGFSAFKNPWHLWLYVQITWAGRASDDVLGFTGQQVGTGNDGEPLVVPDGNIVQRFTWDQFQRELLDTPMPPIPAFPLFDDSYMRSWETFVRERGWGDGPVYEMLRQRYPDALYRAAASGWNDPEWVEQQRNPEGWPRCVHCYELVDDTKTPPVHVWSGDPECYLRDDPDVWTDNGTTAEVEATRKTAGPGSGVIPLRVRDIGPININQPRPVVLDPAAIRDFNQVLEGDERKKVKKAIDLLEQGRAPLEPKTRDLTGAYGLRIDEDCRMLVYPHVDGAWHAFALTHHDYDEVARRWRAASKTAMPMDADFLSMLDWTESRDSADQVRHLEAWDGATSAGYIEVFGRYYSAKARGRIKMIQVWEQYQRKGLATMLWEEAQRRWPDLKIRHSEDRTVDGDAWARSVGGPIPRRKMAALARTMYHLTDKVDFKLDPKRKPNNNTTFGTEWPHPGIFLTDDPERWVNGYGYWRPWVVEFDVDPSVAQDENFMGQGYNGEVFIPATAFDKIRITRVLPLDGYCREEYDDWGWTEQFFETDYLTGEPLPEYNSMFVGPPRTKPPAGRAPDARTMDPTWRNAYKKRVKEYARKSGRGNGVYGSKGAVTPSCYNGDHDRGQEGSHRSIADRSGRGVGTPSEGSSLDRLTGSSSARRVTASVFTPSQVATWEQTKPWEASREDLEYQRVPGIRVGQARGSEDASFQNGAIVVKDQYFDRPPETRRAILYHEAGHGLETEAPMPADALDWIDLPGADALGANYSEIVAETYATLWTDPQWFEGRAEEIRNRVVALAREHGYPLPRNVRTASWIQCSDGERRWGPYGAAGVLFRHREDGETVYLLAKRGQGTDSGGTWAIPGGALDHANESPVDAAMREASEELGGLPSSYRVVRVIEDRPCPEWAYWTVIVDVDTPFAGHSFDWETDEAGWFLAEEVAQLNLHPAFAKSWPKLRSMGKLAASEEWWATQPDEELIYEHELQTRWLERTLERHPEFREKAPPVYQGQGDSYLAHEGIAYYGYVSTILEVEEEMKRRGMTPPPRPTPLFLPNSKTAAPVRGIDLDVLWKNSINLSIVFVSKGAQRSGKPWVGNGGRTDFEHPPRNMRAEIDRLDRQARETYDDTLKRILDNFGGLDYIALVGSGKYGYNLAEKTSINGQWGPPRHTVPEGYGDGREPLPTFFNHLLYGSDDELLKVLLEEVGGVPFDDRQFAGIEEGQTHVVYRGISLNPGDDPTSTAHRDRQSIGGAGSSWTLSEDAAMAIAERGKAGFSGTNIPGDGYWMYVKDARGDRRSTGDNGSVPTVLRAEVVIEAEGPAPYRPWGVDYTSEMEIDIPRNTEFTMTGWKQAEAIPVNAAEKARAEKIYDEAKAKEARGEYDFDALNAGYYVRWRWGPWRNVNIRRRAMKYVFDVDYATDKDSLMAGEVVAGTRRVVIDAANEWEAKLLAQQMVACDAEPTGIRRVSQELQHA